MDLALTSIKMKIGLAVLMFAMAIINGDTAGVAASEIIGGAFIVFGGLMLFYLGLQKQVSWIAVLFGIVCAFDLFGAITGGLNLARVFDLVDAVLSFVAICGIVIWFREERRRGST
ncbi:MAG: hypothetical protein V3U96_01595 [Paracoccaceae bacterium]